MFNIKQVFGNSGEKLEIDSIIDEVFLKTSGGLLLLLAVSPFLFEPGFLDNAFAAVIGVYLGGLVLLGFDKLGDGNRFSRDEFEKRIMEKSSWRAYSFLIITFTVYMAWRLTNGLTVDYNLIYIAAASVVIEFISRFTGIWPGKEEIQEYGEELQEEQEN